MPAASDLSSVVDRHLLLQLGGRLRHARLKQRLTTTQMAERAGVSRMTLRAVEAGDPSPTMGTYVRVMAALGLSRDLALLASDALQVHTRVSAAEPGAAGFEVSASSARHELHDLQSLMLHQEAVRLMKKRPELIDQAIATLERWRAAGDSPSRFLWDEWSVILHRRAWRRALSSSKHSRELRQASPLTTVLPPEARQRVLDEVRRLEKGVSLGQLKAESVHRKAGGSRRGA